MKRIILQYIKEFVYWLLFFVVFKALFLICNHEQTAMLSSKEIAQVFLHGLSMDLSATGYLTAIPALLLCLIPWLPQTTKYATRVYTIIMLIILCLMGFGDMLTYGDWGVRLNVGMLSYLKDWRGVLMNFAWWQWLLIFTALGSVVALWYWIHWKVVEMHDTYINPSPTANKKNLFKRIAESVVAVLLTGVLILPIRGGLDTSPMSFANVWFSDKLYANHAACNYFWGFMSSIIHYQKNELPVKYYNSPIDLDIPESNYAVPQDVLTEPANIQPNIMFVLLESFSQYMVEEGYCPRLKEIADEGLSWSQCYATGNRSDKGMAAVMAGEPALIQFGSVLNYEERIPNLHSLPKILHDNGYQTAFLYGGDVNFYNTRIFMLQQGVSDITERGDFPLSISSQQKWGAPDEYLYQKTIDKITALAQAPEESNDSESPAPTTPWFVMCYNISSHPPFDIPKTYPPSVNNDTRSLFCRSVSYADSCLGHFVHFLKQSEAWKNTLLIITSDHTAYLPLFGFDVSHPEAYRIPVVLSGGVLSDNYCHKEMTNAVSQTDVLETILGLLKVEHARTPFSQSMFRDNGFATYYRDEFWGYVSDSTAYSVSLETSAITFYKNSETDTLALENGKRYTQAILETFLSK